MELVLEIAVCLWFMAWFAISVASQFSDRVCDRFPRMATLGLIPFWTFFAPRPGVHDLHLLYRDKLSDGGCGTTLYVPTIEGRRWYHAIWNPKKFHSKVVDDLAAALHVQFVEIQRNANNLRILTLSTPYLMLVNLVMRMPRPPGATARQFILALNSSCGPAPNRAILFVSEFHHFAEP
jgi:hypothetical protein